MIHLRIQRVSANIHVYHCMSSSTTSKNSFIKLPRILAKLETDSKFYLEKAGKVLVSSNRIEEKLLRKEFNQTCLG